MQFNEVVGQEHAVKILRNSIRGNRVAHAYLFTGPRGVGKGTLVKVFAQALLCYGATEAESCEKCIACQKVSHDNHPDVHYLTPIGNAIKIEQVRELQKQAYYAPYESERKIFIIEQIDAMTQEAANSFLKILEEPPGDTVFLLTSSVSYSILPTIISRCQLIHLHKIPRGEIEKYLIKHKGLEPKEAALLAALADGSLGKAVDLADKENLASERRKLEQLVQNLQTGGGAEALKGAEDLERPKEELLTILDILLLWFRDVLIFKSLGDISLIVNQDMEESLNQGKNLYSEKALGHILEAIEETKRNILMNANARLSLEVLLLKIQQLSQKP